MRARDRYNLFTERHEIAWEVTMGLLALVWLALGLIGDQYVDAGPIATGAELAITVVFVLEFGTRLLAAHDRTRYLRGHWIDAVALLPTVRAVRLLRLLRLLRLVRAFAAFYRAGMHLQRLSRHRGFAAVIIAWLAVMVLCSAFVFAAEHGVNKLMDTPFDALWWGVTTMTTVGYGDTVPITPEGRLGAMVLMVLGVGLFSAITAIITSYTITSSGSRGGQGDDLVAQLGVLAELRESGSLTEAEFGAAKAVVLASAGRGS